jgi:AAA domain
METPTRSYAVTAQLRQEFGVTVGHHEIPLTSTRSTHRRHRLSLNASRSMYKVAGTDRWRLVCCGEADLRGWPGTLCDRNSASWGVETAADVSAEVGLLDTVYARLEADTSLLEEVRLLVFAAVDGEDDLAGAVGSSRDQTAPNRQLTSPPVHAYLSSITVRGFRGVGPEVSLDLVPAPGLTVVAGRNGCGKSSFAEALEVALTRNSYRWHTRTAVWSESWRNLHLPEPASITVQLAEEGSGQITVGVDWASDAALGGGTWWTQRRPARRQAGLDALGWTHDLEIFRPFLSYDELGAVLERPASR